MEPIKADHTTDNNQIEDRREARRRVEEQDVETIKEALRTILSDPKAKSHQRLQAAKMLARMMTPPKRKRSEDPQTS